jgi:hypothetical protein
MGLKQTYFKHISVSWFPRYTGTKCENLFMIKSVNANAVPIQNGLKQDILMPKLFNFALEYTASNDKENHKIDWDT